ncbi:MAG: hypothetical protein HOO96_29580 [Polyangiaceae bacterium]|nr:hypothetical protein [Polyangiaceae bacterium]
MVERRDGSVTLAVLAAALASACAAQTPHPPARPLVPVAPPVIACPERVAEAAGDEAPMRSLLGASVVKVCLVGAASPLLTAAIKTQPGDRLDANRIDADIAALVALGPFDDVRVVTKRVGDGVVVLYDVHLRKRIMEVSIVDDAPGTEPKLDDVMKVFRDSYAEKDFVPAEAKRVALLLQAEYAFHGYGNARVDFEALAAASHTVNLRYKVARGQRWTLATVVFVGAEKVPVTELKAATALEVGAPYSALLGERAGLLVQALLWDKGLLTSKVVVEPLTVDGQGNVELTLTVTEGARYKVGSVSFPKQSASTTRELRALVKTRASEVFHRTRMTSDMAAVKAFFARRGRAVDATPTLEVDPRRESVDIVVRIEDAVAP